MARIFYRNSFAIGLPALEVPGISKKVSQFDQVEVDLESWSVRTVKDGQAYKAKNVPDFLIELVKEGGIVEYYKHHKSFPWDRLEKLPVASSNR